MFRSTNAPAGCRDQISDVRKAASRQEVVSDRPENFDLIALRRV